MLKNQENKETENHGSQYNQSGLNPLKYTKCNNHLVNYVLINFDYNQCVLQSISQLLGFVFATGSSLLSDDTLHTS